MQNYKWFMGIDVSKSKLDITLLKGSEKVLYQLVDNDIKGLEKFVKEMRKQVDFSWNECLVCAEHTGIYNAHFLAMAEKYNWHVCLESGVQIKQSGGLQRGKNDIVDSYRIAVYACKNVAFLKLWQPCRKVLIALKKLSALRVRLLNVKNQLNTALKEETGFTDKELLKTMQHCSKQSLAALDKDIKLTEQKIQSVISSDDQLKELFAIVASVPGIGHVTAVQMILTTNEFKQISDPRKYACYSGVAPFEHSSGSSIRGRTRTSKKANQYVKSILHMGSLRVVRCCPEMKLYYERKVMEGKSKMSILNAVKNKMIHRVFACVNRFEPYQINFRNTLVLS